MCAKRTLSFVVLFILCDFVFAQNICLTPRQTEGLCINIQQCQPLYTILQRKPVSPDNLNYVRQSTCGFEGTDPKVCCDHQMSTNTQPAALGSCTTPHNTDGTCIVIDQCPQLFRILTQQPITPQSKSLLRQSQCGQEGAKPKVCCPIQTGVPTTPRPTNQGTTTQKIDIDTGTGKVPNTPLLPQIGECGYQGLADRILNGEVTSIDEFPWMALLEYSERGFGCGGVLISKRYVLTAAHCVKGEVFRALGQLISVRLGEYDLGNDTDCVHGSGGFTTCSDTPQDIEVEQIIAHPNWVEGDRNHYHDLGIVRLKHNIMETDFVKPVCLPNVHMRANIGEATFVAGWGRTETGLSSDIKLKLQVPIVGVDKCGPPYSKPPYGVTLIEGQICAGGENLKDSCRGDSGGPLLRHDIETDAWFVTGVVSFGPDPCGQKDFPGIYTSVPQYAKWIISNMRP